MSKILSHREYIETYDSILGYDHAVLYTKDRIFCGYFIKSPLKERIAKEFNYVADDDESEKLFKAAWMISNSELILNYVNAELYDNRYHTNDLIPEYPDEDLYRYTLYSGRILFIVHYIEMDSMHYASDYDLLLYFENGILVKTEEIQKEYYIPLPIINGRLDGFPDPEIEEDHIPPQKKEGRYVNFDDCIKPEYRTYTCANCSYHADVAGFTQTDPDGTYITIACKNCNILIEAQSEKLSCLDLDSNCFILEPMQPVCMRCNESNYESWDVHTTNCPKCDCKMELTRLVIKPNDLDMDDIRII